MSHLACAESRRPSAQREPDQAVPRDPRRSIGGIPASLANSSGIFLGDAALCDLVRPGAALYGVNPTPGRPNPMRGVVELTGRILQVRGVAAGETVGYGATWTAKRRFAHRRRGAGLCRRAVARRAAAATSAPGGTAIVAEKPCPIVGRISMDLACVDVTDLPDSAVHRGDLATLIGAGITIDDFAAAAGTIGYEILTRLGVRCHLVYRGLDSTS